MSSHSNAEDDSVIELRKSQSTIQREIAFKYVPLASSASLTAFGSTLMDPSVFAHFGEWSDTVRNSLWISACAGLGMWIYDRPHLKSVNERKRALYALGLSSIFVQGSFLTCALARKLTGDAIQSSIPRLALGATLAGGCIKFGKSYMDFVDREQDEEEEEEEDEEEEESVLEGEAATVEAIGDGDRTGCVTGDGDRPGCVTGDGDRTGFVTGDGDRTGSVKGDGDGDSHELFMSLSESLSLSLG